LFSRTCQSCKSGTDRRACSAGDSPTGSAAHASAGYGAAQYDYIDANLTAASGNAYGSCSDSRLAGDARTGQSEYTGASGPAGTGGSTGTTYISTGTTYISTQNPGRTDNSGSTRSRT
jgi:hypothetical protein